MPGTDDEQDKNKEDEVVDMDKVERTSDGEISSGTKDDKAEGELGDSEQVMSESEPPKRSKLKRFFAGYWRKKKWTLPVTLLAIIAIIFAVPATRYPLLALHMKRQFDVVVIDSKTQTPVSGASVTLDGKTVMTNSVGGAIFQAKVGKRTVEVSKQYYKSFSESVFVGAIHKSTNARFVHLVATGRQVPITVVNKITGKPVANAEIKVLDTEAKTNTDGKATIVLPTGSQTQPATVTASAYNNLTTTVQVTSKVVDANKFTITPSGHVYFLSNLSGNVDVVSTNLDGTDRKTVLAGTGSEDQNNTVLLASRDWNYLALLSKRDGGQYAKLFLINTSNDQVTTMDEGTTTFTPVGWDNHYFVYQVNRANVQDWQSGQSALKTYNADTGKLATLDQTAAQGKQYLYVNQSFGYGNTHIVDGKILYVKEWNSDYLNQLLNGKKDQVLAVNPDSSGKQVLKEFPISASMQFVDVATSAYKPQQIYIQFSSDTNTVDYVYENGNVTQSNALTPDNFSQSYPTYLQSPTGNQTFWSEQRDGKNTLFVGDADGSDGKQIATLSDYAPYGWYTDNYLLVEKDGSELYAMPIGGGTAVKISDYYKSPRSFYGYGSGYGGL